MADFLRAETDFSAVEAEWDAIAQAATEAVRPAAQAGIDVVYQEARLRCPVLEGKGHWFYGRNQKYWFPRGTLRDSIYQVYSKDNSGEGRATYHCSWNYQKAPYGFMVEFGTSRAPAHPFLRPAYEAVSQLALEAANDVLFTRIQKAIA